MGRSSHGRGTPTISKCIINKMSQWILAKEMNIRLKFSGYFLNINDLQYLHRLRIRSESIITPVSEPTWHSTDYRLPISSVTSDLVGKRHNACTRTKDWIRLTTACQHLHRLQIRSKSVVTPVSKSTWHSATHRLPIFSITPSSDQRD